MKKTAKLIDEVFDKWLKEHQHRRDSRQIMEETTDDQLHDDFMGVALSVVQKGSFQTTTITKAPCLVSHDLLMGH